MVLDNISLILGILVALLSIIGSVTLFAKQLAKLFRMAFIAPTELGIEKLTESIDELKETISKLIGQLTSIDKRMAKTEEAIENAEKLIGNVEERVSRLEKIHME